MSRQHKYFSQERGEDPPPATFYKTLNEAATYAPENEDIFRDGEPVYDFSQVACFRMDIEDVKECLARAENAITDLRQRLRAFVEEYKQAPALQEHLPISVPLVQYVKRLAKEHHMTEETLITFLIGQYIRAAQVDEEA